MTVLMASIGPKASRCAFSEVENESAERDQPIDQQRLGINSRGEPNLSNIVIVCINNVQADYTCDHWVDILKIVLIS